MTASSRAWRKAASIAVVEETSQVTLLELDHENSRPLVLTGSALAVWNEIDGVSAQEDIARRLAGAFDRGAAAILEDVSAFLRHLEDAHIIVSTAEATTSAGRKAS